MISQSISFKIIRKSKGRLSREGQKDRERVYGDTLPNIDVLRCEH